MWIVWLVLGCSIGVFLHIWWEMLCSWNKKVNDVTCEYKLEPSGGNEDWENSDNWGIQ